MKFETFFRRLPQISELIDILINKASQCNIERSTIRQLCMPLFKKLVAECSVSELAEICSQGDGFDPSPYNYREAHIVTDGTNAWSAIFLSTCDSGLVLLQKIAVASLLSDVCQVLAAITPQNEKIHGLIPLEIISGNRIDELSELNDQLIELMGW